MTTEPMTQRAAKAICRASYANGNARGTGIDDAIDLEWPQFIPEARAALQALREPTEEMNEVAKPFRKGVGETAERLFSAMIDAALQEKT